MTTMEIEHAVVEKLRALPVEKQQEVLNFLDALQTEKEIKKSLPGNKGFEKNMTSVDFSKQADTEMSSFRDSTGLFAHLGVTITDEELTQVRREMWRNFPREIEI